MYYPTEGPQRAPLLAIPATFCTHRCIHVRQAIVDFFLCGHPLHLLTRQVRFVCESPRHAYVCPNNVVCEFTEDDFVRVYTAVCAQNHPRPNLESELRQWARRAIAQDPAAVGRILDMFPEIESAAAAALQLRGQRQELSLRAVELVYRLVCARQIDLSLVSAAWLQSARSMYNRPGLTAGAVEAFGAFGTWVRYLNSTSRFSEVPIPLQNRVAACIALLCTPRFTSLPVLPPELGKTILGHLLKLQ